MHEQAGITAANLMEGANVICIINSSSFGCRRGSHFKSQHPDIGG
jgi:hypothetical protein